MNKPGGVAETSGSARSLPECADAGAASGHFGLCPRVSTVVGSTWRQSRRWDLDVLGRWGRGGWRGVFTILGGVARGVKE